MATLTHQILLSLTILLGLVAISATARPCKTLFFISTTSYYPIDQDPNFPLRNPNKPRFLTFLYTDVREPNPKPTFFIDRSDIDVDKRQIIPELYSSVTNSIRDRTKDIMSVVGALLFGVGCGALTAATVYLIWSLFTQNRFEFEDSDDDFDNDSDVGDDVSAKKMGYVAIPSVTDAVKPAKDVV
ncbi:unnamed protein product [Ilex paraguariensis]|uniref:Uncharacterized protein n=1 Tax=Ilex paraguariensis TaxID=185542 RepID=A0ABC8RL84_9AQUA